MFVALLAGMALLAAVAPSLADADVYVAQSGSDESGSGAIDRPFRTVTRAAQAARPGDTVYVRGGVYGPAVITRDGTAAAPIAISPYRNESVVFDGAGAAMSDNDSLVTIYDAANIRFSGFEVRNSPGRGISVIDSSKVVVRDNTVHDTWAHPIVGSGDSLTFEDNRIYRGILSNKDGAKRLGYWPGGLSTWLKSNGARSNSIVFRGNLIEDTWGEGIIALHANNVNVTGNTVRNAWSALIYVSDAAKVKVTSNRVSQTTDAFDREGRPAAGILLANEDYSYSTSGKRPVEDLLIANNVISNAFSGVQYWQDPSRAGANTYNGVWVYKNLFVNLASAPIRMDAVPGSEPQPSGNVVAGNRIAEGDDGSTLVVGDPAGWTFALNVYPDGPPVPLG